MTMQAIATTSSVDSGATFDYPFSASCHPMIEEVRQRTLDWMRELGFPTDGRAFVRVERANVAALAAFAYPHAAREVVQLVSDYTAALFLVDDAYDEGELSKDPAGVAALNERYLAELFGYTPPRRGDAVSRAMVDVRERLQALGSITFASRWLASCRMYYEAMLWEATNRRTRRVPETAEYIMLRRHSGNVYAYCDLLELVLDEPLPLNVVQHPLVATVRDICCDVLCWTNDYFSLVKELETGELHNLIVVLGENERLQVGAATERLRRMHDDRIAEYELVKRRILETWSEPAVERYVAATDALIAGNQAWALAAARYRSPRQASAPTHA